MQRENLLQSTIRSVRVNRRETLRIHILAGGKQIDVGGLGLIDGDAVDEENRVIDVVRRICTIAGSEKLLVIEDRLIRTVRIAIEQNAIVTLRGDGRERIRLLYRGEVRSLAPNIGQPQHQAVREFALHSETPLLHVRPYRLAGNRGHVNWIGTRSRWTGNVGVVGVPDAADAWIGRDSAAG